MALKKFEIIEGKGVSVKGNDIDTDRIIPARFMKCVTFEGLGQYTFYDVRFDENGKSTNHPLDLAKTANILISGANFGCGSSREHAPQALYHWGIRAVIAQSFAEIFFGNCITLGIPCLTLAMQELETLHDLIQKNPQVEIQIDLLQKQIKVADNIFNLEIPEQARLSLINGAWDSLGELLESKAQVEETKQRLNIS